MGLIFAYAFAFQIYCDFAAYTTIARGVAKLFGVDLMRNLPTPYFSSNPSEFWTRWHISLSQWLRDYLYIPLGGNKYGSFNTLRNLLITMFLGGLWHGAGILFIVWGVYHGLLLILYRLVPIDTYLVRWLGPVGKLLSIVLFFHLVCIGWIFFRATPEQVGPIFRSIVAFPGAIVDIVSLHSTYWAQVAHRPLAWWPVFKGNLFGFPPELDVFGLCLGAFPVLDPDVDDRFPWLAPPLRIRRICLTG